MINPSKFRIYAEIMMQKLVKIIVILWYLELKKINLPNFKKKLILVFLLYLINKEIEKLKENEQDRNTKD